MALGGCKYGMRNEHQFWRARDSRALHDAADVKGTARNPGFLGILNQRIAGSVGGLYDGLQNHNLYNNGSAG